jgi:phosphatidylcholine synthase
MPEGLALAMAIVVVVTGTLYFADTNMKTSENFFQGFPAVWNVIVFYLLLLRPPSAVAASTIVLLAVLTFAPVRFVHPFRVRRWRAVTVALLTLWAVLAAIAVRQELAPATWVTGGLCLIAIYFLAIGLVPARSEHR